MLGNLGRLIRETLALGISMESHPRYSHNYRYAAGWRSVKRRSKYRPHQGAQECARRIGGSAAKRAVRAAQFG